jgi:hypothetical protein
MVNLNRGDGNVKLSKQQIRGIKEVYNYSLLEAISRRRSRRMGYGFQVPSGALEFRSSKEPVPLTFQETALLCYAGAGITGLTEAGDVGIGYAQNLTNTGRAFPSACNSQRTHLLFTNDEGVYIYVPRPPKKVVQIKTLDDLLMLLNDFDKDVVKIQEGRMQMPSAARPVISPNIYSANQPGQTVFITMADTTYELINTFFLFVKYEGNYLFDDMAGRPVGDTKWIDKLGLKTKLPLSEVESFLRRMHAEEAGCIIQNLLLTAEAIGLGAWPFAGFNNIILMGGSPFAKGLNFRFASDRRGNLNPVGIEGTVLEAHVPPFFKNMNSAVDAIIEDKFGAGGFYDPNRSPSAYRNQESIVKKVTKITENEIQCVKDWCNYLYETYGRFPVTIDAMIPFLCVGVTHLDLEFYDKYYDPDICNETIRNHMTVWHAEE